MFQAEQLHAAFGRRDAALPLVDVVGRDDYELLRPYLDGDGSVTVERTLAPIWAMHVQAYLRLLEAGVPFLDIRYIELDADREGVAARLLAHAGLPASGSSAAVKAFARDSQAGTRIGPDRRDAAPFAATVEEEFRSALARQPRIASPDVLLPDTYS
jgi:hypothetical protein